MRHQGLAMLATAGFACGSAFRPLVPAQVDFDRPALVEPLASSIVFVPTAPAARSYGEPLAAVSTELPPADALFTRVSELARRSLTRDSRLDLVATELAAIGHQGESVSDELLAFALRAHGVFETGHIVLARTDTGLEAALGDQLVRLRESAEYLVGVGLVDGDAAIVMIHRSPLSFSAAPREVHGGVALRGTLAEGVRHAHVIVTREDATRVTLPLPVSIDRTFDLGFRCEGHVGTQWLAFEADGDPRPFAVIPFSCGEQPASAFRIEPRANFRTSDASRRLLSMIDRERIAHGLAPLRVDPRAQHVAAAYSARMLADRSVEHDLDGSDPTSRMRSGGRNPAYMSETTLKADTFALAVEALWNRPEYWKAVMSPEISHVGLAISVAPSGEVFVAIECLQIPPLVDTDALVARFTRALSRTHTSDARLVELARDYSRYVAIGWRSTSAEALLGKRMYRELGNACPIKVRRRKVHVQTKIAVREIADLDHFDVSSLVDQSVAFGSVGIGVTQSARHGPLSGRIYVVAIFGNCYL